MFHRIGATAQIGREIIRHLNTRDRLIREWGGRWRAHEDCLEWAAACIHEFEIRHLADEARHIETVGLAAHDAALRTHLAVLGLEPPQTMEAVKARYRQLVLEHHPDRLGLNAEDAACTDAEDMMIAINRAYDELTAWYQQSDGP